LHELRGWAERADHRIVKEFEDHGISGSKGRDKRPGFDAMLKAAVRREFDLLAVWSPDRLGRSLSQLVHVVETIHAGRVDLYIATQSLDTSTPGGEAMFHMLGVLAQFEKRMIQERVRAGLERVRNEIKQKGHFIAKGSGRRRTKLGPAFVSEHKEAAVRRELSNGTGMIKTARIVGVGVSVVQRVKRELAA
jgi:DNA invertase Pin-like site-specific DNA recombinase